jgi:hypothetical protein
MGPEVVTAAQAGQTSAKPAIVASLMESPWHLFFVFISRQSGG